MNRIIAVWVGLLMLYADPVAAQAGKTASEPPTRCLTDEQLEVNKKLVALNRPTKEGDPDWIFNPEYFDGTWSLEWEVPESVLGAGGVLTGTLTFRHVEACYYEGDLNVKTDRPFNQKIRFLAHPSSRWMTWIETDSRGFTLIKSGPMGGDLGGYFTHYWEAPMFTYRGKKVRLKGNNFLGSPLSFRCRVQISVDGEPFTNFGTQWFRRDSPPPRPIQKP